jgi:small conductance mechanosensitive channel
VHLWQRLFAHAPDTGALVAAVAVAAVLAWACAEITAGLVRRSIARMMTPADAVRHLALVRTPVRLVRVTVWIVLAGVFLPPSLEAFGQPLRTGLRLRTLIQWALDGGLRVLLVVAFAFVMTRFVAIAASQFERSLGDVGGPDQAERAKRARTFGRLIHNAATAFIVAIAAIEILNELGISIAPILTGAGILGLALGFGAQTLVKDVIGGFFLIVENQVRVGDVAEINGVGGLVEAINLRTIVLRDIRGAVHVFPCGSVSTLANLTKDYAYAVLDVRVNYETDLDRATALLQRVAAELSGSLALASAVLAPLEVLGVEQLGDSLVTIRIRLKTVPQQQWVVARDLRRRIKQAFGAEGITMSLPPQQVVLARNPGGTEPPT